MRKSHSPHEFPAGGAELWRGKIQYLQEPEIPREKALVNGRMEKNSRQRINFLLWLVRCFTSMTPPLLIAAGKNSARLSP